MSETIPAAIVAVIAEVTSCETKAVAAMAQKIVVRDSCMAAIMSACVAAALAKEVLLQLQEKATVCERYSIAPGGERQQRWRGKTVRRVVGQW